METFEDVRSVVKFCFNLKIDYDQTIEPIHKK